MRRSPIEQHDPDDWVDRRVDEVFGDPAYRMMAEEVADNRLAFGNKNNSVVITAPLQFRTASLFLFILIYVSSIHWCILLSLIQMAFSNRV